MPESEVEVNRSLKRDTGIGKDSLSIISQENITSIAETKPLDCRGIFEEAAGVW